MIPRLDVRGTTLPADCELTFVGLVALTAVPLATLLGGVFASREQRLGTREVLVTDYPELRQTIQKRDLAQTSGELIVPDNADDPRVLEEILQVADVRERLVSDQSLHGFWPHLTDAVPSGSPLDSHLARGLPPMPNPRLRRLRADR